MTIVYHKQIVIQRHLVCNTLTYHCFLFLNVKLVITFPTDLNTGDFRLFFVPEKLWFLLAKANYQFSSCAFVSSSHVYVRAFELMSFSLKLTPVLFWMERVFRIYFHLALLNENTHFSDFIVLEMESVEKN